MKAEGTATATCPLADKCQGEVYVRRCRALPEMRMANSLPEVCPFGKPLTPRPIHDSRLTGNAVPSRICPAAVYEKGHGCCDGDFYCTWRGRYLRIVHPPACNGARPSAACILEAT